MSTWSARLSENYKQIDQRSNAAPHTTLGRVSQPLFFEGKGCKK